MNGLLEQGIQAYKQGNKSEARRYFVQAIKADPKNEQAWLYLTQVANSTTEREKCLRQVLKINPNNEKAAKALEKMMGAKSIVPTKSVEPVRAPISQAAEAKVDSFSVVDEPESKKEKEKDWIDRFLPVFMIMGGLLFVCLFIAMIGSSFSSDENGSEERAGSGFSLFGGSNTPVSALTAKDRERILSGVQSNISAHNAENIEWYMNTIHPDSPMRRATEKELEKVYPLFDLQASLSNLEILSVTESEARVQFTLTTVKIDGPSFRNNAISGVFVMRLDNGTWKIYNQKINDVNYFDS